MIKKQYKININAEFEEDSVREVVISLLIRTLQTWELYMNKTYKNSHVEMEILEKDGKDE